MLLCIASDSHDRWDHLEKAVEIANERGCQALLFAGDFMSPPGLLVLKKFKGQVHFVWGNNDGEKVGLTRQIDESENMTLYGDEMSKEIDGLKFYMNHYPHIVQDAALSDQYDVCIYGHDHIYHEETLDNGTLLLNPGEIQGYKTGTVTFILFDTETKKVEKMTLSED